MSPTASTLPAALRVYAIGDVHGSLNLLKALNEKIDAECARDGIAPQKIFLGDYIDRGLQSRGVIEFLLGLKVTEKYEPIFLMGNHEQVMRGLILEKDPQLLADWLTFGGRETLLSYGLTFATMSGGPQRILTELVAKLPATHLDFLKGLELSVSFGDYYFCHAGVRPGIDLARQQERDLVWIRKEFLDSDKSFEKTVVHGHSIRPQAEFKSNRIGIDTGAYATGCLTALGLEGTKQWLVQTK